MQSRSLKLRILASSWQAAMGGPMLGAYPPLSGPLGSNPSGRPYNEVPQTFHRSDASFFVSFSNTPPRPPSGPHRALWQQICGPRGPRSRKTANSQTQTPTLQSAGLNRLNVSRLDGLQQSSMKGTQLKPCLAHAWSKQVYWLRIGASQGSI